MMGISVRLASGRLANMTTFGQIDQALAAHGWRYQASHEQFYEGNREITWKDVLGLVPGMTLDELASYQTDKWRELRASGMAS
jgi:hypothetical protein